jgi:hypothetical protein
MFQWRTGGLYPVCCLEITRRRQSYHADDCTQIVQPAAIAHSAANVVGVGDDPRRFKQSHHAIPESFGLRRPEDVKKSKPKYDARSTFKKNSTGMVCERSLGHLHSFRIKLETSKFQTSDFFTVPTSNKCYDLCLASLGSLMLDFRSFRLIASMADYQILRWPHKPVAGSSFGDSLPVIWLAVPFEIGGT